MSEEKYETKFVKDIQYITYIRYQKQRSQIKR